MRNLNTFYSIWPILFNNKYFYGDSNSHANFGEAHQDLIDFHEFH